MSKRYKFYVVCHGRKNGVYDEWSHCLSQVSGFPHNCYLGFHSWEAVQKYILLSFPQIGPYSCAVAGQNMDFEIYEDFCDYIQNLKL